MQQMIDTLRKRLAKAAGFAGAAALAVGLASTANADLTEIGAYGDTGAAGGIAEITASNPALGNYSLLANGVDFWGNSDNGMFAYDPVQVSGDFSAVVRSVSVGAGAGEEIAGEWGRSGIMARTDGVAANSPNVSIIRKTGGANYGIVLQGRDTTGGGTNRLGGSEMPNSKVPNEPVQSKAIWLSLHRQGEQYFGSWAPDVNGQPGNWAIPATRFGTPDLNGDMFLGLIHQSHNIHPTANTAVFESFTVGDLDMSRLPAIPGPAVAEFLGIGPEGGDGFWGIREVVNNGTVSRIEGAIDSLLSGTGDFFEGEVPVINFLDPESGDSDNFPNDSPFLSDTDADDNGIALIGNGIILIEEEGDYTFGFRGDDASRLLIDGAEFYRPGLQAELLGNGIQFAADTGDSHSLGVTHLTPGKYPIEVIWNENGGGASVEVFAAKGAYSTFNDRFALIGGEGRPSGEAFYPGLVGDVDILVVDFTDGRTVADWAAVGTALDNPDDSVANIFNGTATTIYHGDTDNGHPSLPGLDDGVGNDQFAARWNATLDVPESAVYTFKVETDDGTKFTIDGADFTLLNSANFGATSIINNGATVNGEFNTGNTDILVETFLTAGEHDLELDMWEQGGGAYGRLSVNVDGTWKVIGEQGSGSFGDPGAFAIPLVAAEAFVINGGGETYSQDFDVMETGKRLPKGWTGVTNDGSSKSAVGLGLTDGFLTVPNEDSDGVLGVVNVGGNSDSFGPAPDGFIPTWTAELAGDAGAFGQDDAVVDGATDRALGVSRENNDDIGELNFEIQIAEKSLRAFVLDWDLEIWGGDPDAAFRSDEGPGMMVDVTVGGTSYYDETQNLLPGAKFDSIEDQSGSDHNATLIDGNVHSIRGMTSGIKEVSGADGAVGNLVNVSFNSNWNGATDDGPNGWTSAIDNVRLRALAPGDADANGVVDVTDLLQLLGGQKFNQGVDGVTWEQGDFNADDQFDTSDLLAMLSFLSGTFPSDPYASEAGGASDAVADIIVNSETGEVTVDLAGHTVSAIIIESASEIFNGQQPEWDTTSQFPSTLPGELGNVLFTSTAAGVDELGAVISAEFLGRDKEFYLQDLDLNILIASEGGTLTKGNVIVVPEPSTWMLLGLGSLAIVGVIRRRMA